MNQLNFIYFIFGSFTTVLVIYFLWLMDKGK